MNKTDKKTKMNNLYWIISVIVIVLVSTGFIWNWQANKDNPGVSSGSDSQSSTSISSSEDSKSDLNISSGNNNSQDGTTISSGNSSETTITDNHIVPEKEIEITIPTPPIGDVEDPPNLNEGIQLNSIHKGIEEMTKNLRQMEKELEEDPTNQGLIDEIEETKKIIEELKKEMEKLLNGDL